jgi:hypothetical protein
MYCKLCPITDPENQNSFVKWLVNYIEYSDASRFLLV